MGDASGAEVRAKKTTWQVDDVTVCVRAGWSRARLRNKQYEVFIRQYDKTKNKYNILFVSNLFYIGCIYRYGIIQYNIFFKENLNIAMHDIILYYI